jgi:hypothetical protein
VDLDITIFLVVLKNPNWIVNKQFVMSGNLWIVLLFLVVLGLDLYIIWARLQVTEGFNILKNESLYDLMAKEAQISNEVYMQKIKDADVIQSNPWIMIDRISNNATIYPRKVLDRLTGQQPESLSWHPRNYYEYSDVLYTGLPL